MATIDSAAASAVWNDGSNSSTRNNRVACASSSSASVSSSSTAAMSSTSSLPSETTATAAAAAATEAARNDSNSSSTTTNNRIISVNSTPLRRPPSSSRVPAPNDGDQHHRNNATTTAAPMDGDANSGQSSVLVQRFVNLDLTASEMSEQTPADIVDEDLNEEAQQHAGAHHLHISPPAASSSSAATSPSSACAGGASGTVTRPIYPNVPYSPYGSPYGSPRGRKRQPFRESRRISIEHNESFLQLNQYKLYDKIGQGSYGLVKLAYSEEDSTHYAMKIMSKRKLLRKAGLMGRGPKRGPVVSPLDRVYREIAVLKKLDHPNVVKLVEVLDDPLEDSLYLVFEWLELGAVLTVPTDSPLTEQRAWSVFRDALLGLEYLHYQRIIHSDLKPDNLLVGKNGRVQIADLGVCNEFDGNDASMSNVSTPGTPAFRAPETLLTGQHSYNGRAVDVWALGATLYALVFGNVPFVAESVPVLYERIRIEPLRFPDEAQSAEPRAKAVVVGQPAAVGISAELRHLLHGMLEKNTERRLTVPQIKLDAWVTRAEADPLPGEAENCCQLVDVTEDDINSVVTSIPKLDTLILIKNMLKKHSFGNPYATKSTAGQARIERFMRAGRSNSAPGAYHGMERQLSSDSLLPPVSEVVGGTTAETLAEEEPQDA